MTRSFYSNRCHESNQKSEQRKGVGIRIESGSDDPDNVGGHLCHFFDGSSGSHPQTKLSRCDLEFLVH